MLGTRRALIGLSLTAALTMAGVQLANTATAASASGVAATAGCTVADDLALRAGANAAGQGHYPHEAWLATGKGPTTVTALGEDLAARFGTDTKQAPYQTLERGLIGTAVDHIARQLVVVVDPALVPVPALHGVLQSRLDAAGLGPATGIGLRVQAGCHSSASLLAAVRTLSARAWTPAAKQVTFGFHVEPRDSTVHVTFGPADTGVADAARQQLGAAATVSIGNPTRRDRLTDGEPHWGGAAIGFLNNRFCTAGFVIRRNSDGVRGGVTAGHCFNNGANVYSGSQFWGTANGESGYPTWDMIRINSSTETYANRIHVDPCCPSVRTVTGRANPVLNELLCVSGYVTRAVCGIRVTSLNGQLCDPDGCTPGLFVASKPGSTVGQGGDSGAPSYVRPTSTTATIRGIEVGGTAPDNFYGEKVLGIEAHLGVTVATS
jgi:hypothetical protein